MQAVCERQTTFRLSELVLITTMPSGFLTLLTDDDSDWLVNAGGIKRLSDPSAEEDRQ